MKCNLKYISISLLLAMLGLSSVKAQVVSFEGSVPYYMTSSDKKGLSLTNKFYKDGEKSLEWSFSPNGTMEAKLPEPIQMNAKRENTYGITLWIYNEEPQKDSVRFEFLNDKGEVAYSFDFRLASAGWRACWMGFKTMKGAKGTEQTITAWRLIAPDRKGRIFIDRLLLPQTKMNLRTTPDMQVDGNSLAVGRDLWHWCRVWEWEQYRYDIPCPVSLTAEEKAQLKLIESRMDKEITPPKNIAAMIKKADGWFNRAKISPSGKGFTGAPIVAPDELNRSAGEMTWNDIEAMLAGFAYDAVCNNSSTARSYYFKVWKYAMDQGFAYGSGMGTNHHYGYQTRQIFTTAWLMRNEIWKAKEGEDILKTLAFWSGLQETRRPCQENRDEMVDSWHTLLMARLISAMMIPDECRRVQALRGLSRWVAGSLTFSSGTIGGIKVDGTTFHHGGFYPAYTTGALAAVAEYISMTDDTEFALTHENCKPLMKGLYAMRNYTNRIEWGYALAGRHPFEGKLGPDDIDAFARMALSPAERAEGEEFNKDIAADYLRLQGRKSSEYADFFRSKGVEPAKAPQGFFVYNYGAAGIHRRNDWMVTLKGFNSDVWGAEIYVKDNRFGRYQSYGSVQIMSKPGMKASGYQEEGWDWNRFPGTTTIHLPLELLNNPNRGTMMARNRADFSGSSSLEGKNGMFVLRLKEANFKNFTPDFVARKSVFCFDNRMVCLGTGISNGNASFNTETTLFQNVFVPGKTPVSVNGQTIDKDDFNARFRGTPNVWLSDGYGNYYQVPEGLIFLSVGKQQSAENRLMKPTEGTFAQAFITHGAAPKDAAYSYFTLIQPTDAELAAAKKEQPYEVRRRDNVAHIVYDKITGITGYAAFEKTELKEDPVVAAIDEETMVMQRMDGKSALVMSVCDPNLHIKDKGYTTDEPSKPFVKKVVLKGQWKLSAANPSVVLKSEDSDTVVEATCCNGQPVEFRLIR